MKLEPVKPLGLPAADGHRVENPAQILLTFEPSELPSSIPYRGLTPVDIDEIMRKIEEVVDGLQLAVQIQISKSEGASDSSTPSKQAGPFAGSDNVAPVPKPRGRTAPGAMESRGEAIFE